jgi:hypothetical protein
VKRIWAYLLGYQAYHKHDNGGGEEQAYVRKGPETISIEVEKPGEKKKDTHRKILKGE